MRIFWLPSFLSHRHFFLPDFVRAQAYDDMPVAIGCGQTISQPSLVLRMIALLDVQPGQLVLDVGSGSGFVSSLLSHLLKSAGLVHAVEFESSLIEGSRGVLGLAAERNDVAPIILNQAIEHQAGRMLHHMTAFMWAAQHRRESRKRWRSNWPRTAS